MKVIVINMDESTKRWSSFYNTCKELNIQDKVERFKAVSKHDTDRLNILKTKFKCGLSGGEAGCALSHLLVIKKFLESSDEYVSIFEDDAKIMDAEFLQIDKLLNDIGVKEFDILYLTKRMAHNAKFEIKGGWGTEGYILTKKGAQNIYNILTCGSGIFHPIDNHIQGHIHGMVNCRSSRKCTQYPNLWLKAYRTKKVYVKHFPNGISDIGRCKDHWLTKNDT